MSNSAEVLQSDGLEIALHTAASFMKAELLSLACGCGHPSSSFVQVGLTSDHQVVFNWWCSACDQPVHVFKSLSECWRECPPMEQAEILEEPATADVPSGESDSAFLAAVGIAVPVDRD